MKELMIATKNAHKVEEFRAMLEPFGYRVLSLLDLEEDLEVEETGTTFAENAYLKAKAACDKAVNDYSKLIWSEIDTPIEDIVEQVTEKAQFEIEANQ